nr:type VII secretion-associated protein [Saccharopolyspora sp. HNM0983]
MHVSIDFGTSSTCAVVAVGGGEPQVVVVDGQPLVPSAVFAAPDGTLFVGHEAERQAAVDPARFEPHPKRRIDEGELLLGSTVLPVPDAVRAVLGRAVAEARRYAGGAVVDLLVLTHPANWGSVRTGVLRRAAAGLGREIALVPEPVAAAVFHSAGLHSAGLADGAALAVLDMGGGTVDASAVAKNGPSFDVLATRGDPNFGGADIDQALLDHVGTGAGRADPAAWAALAHGREMPDRRRRRVLRQDVRGAKETLSRHTYTDVPLPQPFSDAHVTRADLEGLVHRRLAGTAELVLDTLRTAQVERGRLAGVFLVGGSSRIPLVSRLVHERTGVVPTTLDQPETVVARGALRAVRLDPERAARAAGGTTVRKHPVGPPSGIPPAVAPGDSLSRASTIVIGASDATRPVSAARRPAAPAGNRLPWLVAAAIAAAALLGLIVMLLTTGGGGAADSPGPGSRVASGDSAAPSESESGGRIAQYDYSFAAPAGWHQIGGDPQSWQTLVAPVDGDGADRIAVQEGRLDVAVEDDPERAVQDLRAEYDRRVAGGESFAEFTPRASFAGRDVAYYREQHEGTTVEWYVLHRGRSRVFVGCQYAPEAVRDVRAACEQVVGSVRIG